MTAYLAAQFASLQLERETLLSKQAGVSRELEAARREVALANEARGRAEDEIEASRALLAAQTVRLQEIEKSHNAAEATITTLLARLRVAEDALARSEAERSQSEERLSNELVQARIEVATTRFELDEALLAQKKARQALAVSKESETALERQLAAERLTSADLALRLEHAQQQTRRMMAELKERDPLAQVKANAVR